MFVCGSFVSAWNWNVSLGCFVIYRYGWAHMLFVDCMQLICIRPKWICLTFFDARFLSINWDADRINGELNSMFAFKKHLFWTFEFSEIVKAFTCQSHLECENYLILNLLKLPAQQMLVHCCHCSPFGMNLFSVHPVNTNHLESKTKKKKLLRSKNDWKWIATVFCISIDSVQLICICAISNAASIQYLRTEINAFLFHLSFTIGLPPGTIRHLCNL